MLLQFNKSGLFPANTYLFKVKNKNTKKRYEICLKLTIKTPERRQLWTYFSPFSNVSIVDFEQINISWVSLALLTKNYLYFTFNETSIQLVTRSTSKKHEKHWKTCFTAFFNYSNTLNHKKNVRNLTYNSSSEISIFQCTLREKCPSTWLFLVRIFLYSV